jgi:probable peroxiredoxin
MSRHPAKNNREPAVISTLPRVVFTVIFSCKITHSKINVSTITAKKLKCLLFFKKYDILRIIIKIKEIFMDERINMPLLGDAFPTLQVQTTQGPMTLPADLKGSWFIVFSHPADFTPVCTTEFVGFQELMPEFEKLGVKLVGLSVDQVFSHMKWIEWMKDKLNVQITFPVIAANDAIANSLGLLHPGKGTNTVRAVFIVDPEGKLRLVLYYPQEIGRNMKEILRAVKALQISDKEDVALPANWPENSLIKDHAIVPPPSNVKAAEKRLKEYEGFDWWFCHKALK